jgi:hypothetical protein
MPVDPLENFINQNRDDFDQELPSNLWDKISDGLETSKDGLEDFVNGQRSEFDTEDPPAGLWNKILASLPASAKVVSMQTRRSPSTWYRAAAAAVILLVAGSLYLGSQIGYKAGQEQQLALIYAIDPDFPEAEVYYQNEIEQLYHQVSNHNSDPELYADLKDIDRSMKELREQLTSVPREEQAALVADLIMSYQIKLQILQKVMQHLPDQSSTEETENPTIKI